MKKLIIALTTLASLSANALPFQVSNLALSCKDSSMRIPESQIIVEVFAATQKNPNHQLRITHQDLNAGATVLFDGPVAENFGEKSSLLSSDDAELFVKADKQGLVTGYAALKNGTEVLKFPVTCQKFYQIMKSAELE